jgi:2-deoxy-D-gluconate 3-dehydrogenase
MSDGAEGAFSKEVKEAIFARIPQGRYGSPEDIGKAVRMLCSDDACYVNGAYLQVDGALLQS